MKNIEDVYELSHMQLGILLDTIYTPGAGGYHQQLCFKLQGNLNEEAFKNAWKKLIDTHEVFRTSFHWEDLEKPMQVVHKEAELVWIYKDNSHLEETCAQQSATDLLVTDKTQAFVLDKLPLIRCYLTKIKKDEWNFIFSYHHLLLDGWCLPIILGNIFNFYSTAVKGVNLPVSKGEPYRNYIQWLQKKDAGAAKKYWEKKLSGFYEANKLTPLPMDYDTKTYQYKEHNFSLPAKESAAMLELAKQLRITPYTILQGFWALTLNKFTLDNDIVFGTTISGRTEEINGVDNMVGLFINTIPIRVGIDNEALVSDWLVNLFEENNESGKYSYASLSDVKKWSKVAHNEHLFETIIVYENYPMGDLSNDSIGLKLSNFELIERPNVPLALLIIPGEVFNFKAIYNGERFNAEFVDSVLQSLLCAVQDFIATSSKSIKQLNWTNGKTDSFFSSAFQLPAQKENDNAWSRFLIQAKAFPAKTLVKEKQGTYTYKEMTDWSNQVADVLHANGLHKGDRVAIYMENSAGMIATLLGVLKIGAVYVPIDPETPASRIDFILKDSAIQLIACDALLINKLKANHELKCKALAIESCNPDLVAITSMESNVSGTDIAYIIYTSGSTGTPKGVQIAHSNLLNYIDWAAGYYVNGETDFPLYSSLAFDLTVTSIYTPLFTGNAIVVYSGIDKALIVQEIIADNQVDIIKLTPSHLKIVRSVGAIQSRVKKMIVGGENLERSLADDVINNFGKDLVLYNEYGPTEATVGCFIFSYDGSGLNGQNVPIGFPVTNMEAYVMDENLNTVPKGAKGELCLAGLSLSPGYLHNEELNASRFVNNTAGNKYPKLYRTGDIVRQNENGLLEFIARKDDQIKVRGHRIEMGEIETILELHPDIKSAAVSLVQLKRKAWDIEDVYYCTSCGIQSVYPNITFDNDGVCSTCKTYESNKLRAQEYFRSMDDLKEIFNKTKNSKSEYDCLVLLSGGKDSTYALSKLVRELKLRVLVFTMDNGYISEQAKDNMKNICSTLNVELVFGSTKAMNTIFKDSLQKYSNVCQGCYKTIYTLSIELAKKRNIPYIITGLSRGQLFETRLDELYNAKIFNPDKIDEWVLNARKEYHRKHDAVSENLNVGMFKEDKIFEEVQFIDFYRYCDATLGEMYTYLEEQVKWVRPEDTGRSTNCLINDLGIYVHKKERGFHNYSLPYSWDVRLGHKKREEALKELDDEIDLTKVKEIMQEVGYQLEKAPAVEEQLFAFYVSEKEIPNHELKAWLTKYISTAVIPTGFIKLDALPLTINGKINRNALRHESKAASFNRAEFLAPGNQLERDIVDVWKEVLGIDNIGVKDNIFDIGGHSMTMTLIFNKLKDKINLSLSLVEMYEYPTVFDLAERIKAVEKELQTEDFPTEENKRRVNRNSSNRKLARAEASDN